MGAHHLSSSCDGGPEGGGGPGWASGCGAFCPSTWNQGWGSAWIWCKDVHTVAWPVSWSLLEFRDARNLPLCVPPAGTAPDHPGIEGHTQVTAWVFCQGQQPLPDFTLSKPEVIIFPKKHSSPAQPKIVPGNPPSQPLP